MQTAIPATIERVLDDGNTYRMAPIALNDWADFCEVINGWKGAKPKMPVSLDEMVNDGLQTPAGLRWILCRSLRNGGHTMTETDAGKLFLTLQSLIKLAETVADLPYGGKESADPTELGQSRELIGASSAHR